MSGNPAAAKLAAKMKRSLQGMIPLRGNAASDQTDAERLRSKVAATSNFADTTESHAVYVYTQNQVSIISEQITAFREMEPFVEIFSEAEDLYSPGGPPMSPLTRSYFTCWVFFDACVGSANQTIGTTILEFGDALGLNTELLRLIRLMQESRMGLYLHKGLDGSVAVLEDLVTGDVRRAIVPAGYLGKKDELWYVRILPAPYAERSEAIVFTTPYVVMKPGLKDWLAYLRRAFPEAASVADKERHMKYGPTLMYWNDFVFEAYVNHRHDVIFLAGLPDVPESRPCSRMNGFGLDRGAFYRK